MASREYMDLFVVINEGTKQRYLVQAPWLSHIEVGSVVIFEDEVEERWKGTVLAKTDVRKDDDELITFLRTMKMMREDKDIPKIVAVVKEVKVDYDE